MLFDTHTHLNADQFQDDIDIVIERAADAGVTKMVVVGFDRKTIERAIALVDKYSFIYAAIGWHPVQAKTMTEADLAWIEKLAAHPKVVAIGETGLDYHWDTSPKDIQENVFRKQIRLAKKLQLPIIVHNRDATGDVINILQEEQAEEVGGIMHCFNSELDAAKACIDMNFLLSFAGPVTFKNATSLQKVAQEVPLEHMLIETDCPYLAPHPFRGKRNEPAYVTYVAEKIAELKGCDYAEIARITTNNAKRLFQITE